MSSVTVMSFNLRTPVEGHPDGHPDQWQPRLAASIELLRHRRPDLIGIQEGTWPQLRPLLEALPDYSLVGTGREGGSRGEFSAILFRADRFRLDGWNQCWLSETPDVVGSTDWDAGCTRIATRADLTDRGSGQVITMVNTHLDHRSELARVKGAQVIIDHLLVDRPAGASLVITGDFNCPAGRAEAWQLLTRTGLKDTWLDAAQRSQECCSYHGYGEPGPMPAGTASAPDHSTDDERIDWILVSDDISVTEAEIVTDRPGGIWPSDHWPVLAVLEPVVSRR